MPKLYYYSTYREYILSTLNLMRRSDGRSSEVGKGIKHDKRVKSEINTHCIVYIIVCNNIIYELLWPLYRVQHTLCRYSSVVIDSLKQKNKIMSKRIYGATWLQHLFLNVARVRIITHIIKHWVMFDIHSVINKFSGIDTGIVYHTFIIPM